MHQHSNTQNQSRLYNCASTDHAPNYGDWNAQSRLQMLHMAYSEYNRFETDDENGGFEGVYDLFEGLPLKSPDAVIDAVCDLYRSHEQSGFTEGLKVGFGWATNCGTDNTCNILGRPRFEGGPFVMRQICASFCRISWYMISWTPGIM